MKCCIVFCFQNDCSQINLFVEMEDLTTRLCWELVKKEGYVAMWRKPVNNSCYMSRDPGVKPPLCDTDDNPDNVWYVSTSLDPVLLLKPQFNTLVTSWISLGSGNNLITLITGHIVFSVIKIFNSCRALK